MKLSNFITGIAILGLIIVLLWLAVIGPYVHCMKGCVNHIGDTDIPKSEIISFCEDSCSCDEGIENGCVENIWQNSN